jgi:hypothetical protein
MTCAAISLAPSLAASIASPRPYDSPTKTSTQYDIPTSYVWECQFMVSSSVVGELTATTAASYVSVRRDSESEGTHRLSDHSSARLESVPPSTW